ncbi:tail fiber protein [uncultured Arcticibacterium sp.]|uniref:phage tail protein n=1 Tax=uncultured Arcticibacterium sp. TaxID=2173042 RepID=UPI0030F610FA
MGTDTYLGAIGMFGGNFAPRGWSTCEGQLIAISSNTALFSLLGTTFGGDGRTTFGLPDLRGRAPIGVGHGPGLSTRTWGQKGGVEDVTLNITQMPNHTHLAGLTGKAKIRLGDQVADSFVGIGRALGQSTLKQSTSPNAVGPVIYDSNPTYNDGDHMHDDVMDLTGVQVQVGNSGGNQYHTNMQPFLAIYFCIATVGVFPSRN